MRKALLWLSLLLLAGAPVVRAADGPYDANANARQTIQAATAQAQAQHKLVLIDFGANWCPDCRALDKAFHTGELARTLEDGFVVAHVDVGKFDKNLDVAKSYGNPIEKGIPAVVVTKGDGSMVYSSKTGALSDARSMDEKSILSIFKSIQQGAAH